MRGFLFTLFTAMVTSSCTSAESMEMESPERVARELRHPVPEECGMAVQLAEPYYSPEAELVAITDTLRNNADTLDLRGCILKGRGAQGYAENIRLRLYPSSTGNMRLVAPPADHVAPVMKMQRKNGEEVTQEVVIVNLDPRPFLHHPQLAVTITKADAPAP